MEKCKNGHERSQENTYVSKKGYRFCRPCRNEAAVRFRSRNKDRVNDWHKDNYTKQSARIIAYKRQYRAAGRHKDAQYNLKVPYVEMLAAQNNKCAVCNLPSADKALAVDHDHSCCPAGTSCGNCVRGSFVSGL